MSVYKAYNAVQKGLVAHGIAKAQKNQQQNYKYRGIDDVYNVLGPLLAEHGLMIVPLVTRAEVVVGQTKSGGTSYHHTVEVAYYIYGPDGDRMDVVPISRGECIDTSDKGLNKALSAAYKYWVLSAFCVPLEGQDDADSVTPEPLVAGVLTEQECIELVDMCSRSNTDRVMFANWMGFNTLADIPRAQFNRAVQALNAKLDKMAREYQSEQTPQPIEGELV
jgi:hypothetical protein